MSAHHINLEGPQDGSRSLAIWEIVSVVTSCLIAEWVVLSFARQSKLIAAIPILMAVGLMFFSHRERGETFETSAFGQTIFSRLVVYFCSQLHWR